MDWLQGLGSTISTGASNLWDGVSGMAQDTGNYLTGGTIMQDTGDFLTGTGKESMVNGVNQIDQGLWGTAKDAGNYLTSDKGANLMKAGIGGFNAYNSYNQGKANQNMMNQQLGMQQDAYNRDVEADNARQNLNF